MAVNVKYSGKDNGAVLILAVIVLVVIFVIVGQFTFTTSIEKKLAENSEEHLKMYYSTRAILEVSKALLAEDDTPVVDSETDLWGSKYKHRATMDVYAASLGFGMGYEIVDSSRYINLAGLWSSNKQIRNDTVKLITNLEQAIEISLETGYDEIAQRLLDYVDEDQTGMYEASENLNKNLVTHEQILDMATLTDEAMDKLYFGYDKSSIYNYNSPTEAEHFPGLKDCTTIWGDNTSFPPRVNINTANREVLVAAILMNNSDIGVDTAREEADRIIEYRDELEENEEGDEVKKYFSNFGKIKADLEEIECPYASYSSRWFTIMAGPPGKSQFFEITTSASSGKISKEIKVVLERAMTPRGGNNVTFHMWREIPPRVPLKREFEWQ